MHLFIDTASRFHATAAIVKRKKTFSSTLAQDPATKKGDLLFVIDTLFRKQKISAKKLAGIIVVSGPGQFSSLRTGIAVANAFGFALQIPVVGVEKKEPDSIPLLVEKGLKLLRKTKRFHPVLPSYGKEPNITQAKPRV